MSARTRASAVLNHASRVWEAPDTNGPNRGVGLTHRDALDHRIERIGAGHEPLVCELPRR